MVENLQDVPTETKTMRNGMPYGNSFFYLSTTTTQTTGMVNQHEQERKTHGRARSSSAEPTPSVATARSTCSQRHVQPTSKATALVTKLPTITEMSTDSALPGERGDTSVALENILGFEEDHSPSKVTAEAKKKKHMDKDSEYRSGSDNHDDGSSSESDSEVEGILSSLIILD